MAPISVWELDAGSPKYEVPRFQMSRQLGMEKTIAKAVREQEDRW